MIPTRIPSILCLFALVGLSGLIAPAHAAGDGFGPDGAGVSALAASAPLPAHQEAPLLGVRIDEEGNRLLLEIPQTLLGVDLLYMNTLATGFGLGSPMMDRGQLGTEAVVRFERQGNRVVMIRDNWSVRAIGANEELARSARESFPTSVIASFPIEGARNGDGAEGDGDSQTDPDGASGSSPAGGARADDHLVVDASSFFLSDVFGVASRIQGAGQGNVRLERDRSWINGEATGAFPMNLEVRAVLTFVSDQPGAALRQAAPDGGAVTMEQHHSLLALPDEEGFRPRPGDGRAGLFSTSFLDFSHGIEGRYRNQYAARWRLVPSDPDAYLAGDLVEPKEPIVFYMDPAISEPYRSAFIEGGEWWNQIFEAAGFRDAFHVRNLPEGVDPLDARHSVLYWVHRRDPGPSVGPSFHDPRTGEILKTVVRMDSHRSLINYNIYAGLLPAAGPEGLPVSAEEFAMARRRQHTAHEIGHTLGIAHNFIAASQGRSSVMDYPAPLIDLDPQGRLDLTGAYRDGGGAWDSLAVRYAYTWFPDEASEREGLQQILQDAIDEGLRFITGGHAAQVGSIPAATQWVEGATMFEALDRTTRVRRLLVDSFDERAITGGEPMSLLNQRFAHVYLHHRYALEGVVKYVGGMDFTYAARGDGQTPARILPADEQRRALSLAMDALEPNELAIPAHLPDLIPPSPYGTDGSEIWISSLTGTAFDPLTLAGGLATEVLENLLHPQRMARVASFHARDASNPSLPEVMDAVVDRSWGAPISPDAGEEALRRVVQRVALNSLLDLGGNANATSDTRAAVDARLAALQEELRAGPGGEAGSMRAAHRALALRDLDRYFAGEDDPSARSRFPVVPLPWP